MMKLGWHGSSQKKGPSSEGPICLGSLLCESFCVNLYGFVVGCDAVPFEEDSAVPGCAAPVVEAPVLDALKVDKLLCISVTSTMLP